MPHDHILTLTKTKGTNLIHESQIPCLLSLGGQLLVREDTVLTLNFHILYDREYSALFLLGNISEQTLRD